MAQANHARKHEIGDIFSRIAQWSAKQCGRAHTFALACFVIVIWAVTGPMFHYSDTWQLIINTGTTIVTFLMVFLMQNTQNRDTAAVQLKLDELIRANERARNVMLSLENLTEDQLERVKRTFAHLSELPDDAQHRLHEARENLQAAGAEVEDAHEKLETVEAIVAEGKGKRLAPGQGRD